MNGWVKSSKPLSVMGRTGSPNTLYEWVNEDLALTESWFYVHRRNGKLGIYASDDAQVTVTKVDWSATETQLLADTVLAGMTSYFEFTEEESKDKLLKVVSDTPVLVLYWAGANNDIVTQEAPTTKMWGCPSSVAMVMNPSQATITETCSDGSTDTWTNIFKKTRSSAHFDGKSCVISTDGAPIMVSSVGDGSGGNA